MASPIIYLPGDALPNRGTAGEGTHMHGSSLYASLAGPLASSGGRSQATSSSTSNTIITSPLTTALLPTVGSIVLGTITRLTPRHATLDMQALTTLPPSLAPSTVTTTQAARTDTVPLPYAHQALIRQQDIRATEIDKVTVSGSFQVGDIVRAVVISVGDERNYYASTAGDAFGVVLGRSSADRSLVGVSWGEMVEVSGGGETDGVRREGRKVAKVI